MNQEQRLGTPQDLQWAQEYVAKNIGSNRIVYAAITPSDDQAAAAGCLGGWVYFLPCAWIISIPFAPCLLYDFFATRRRVSHSMYIVTNLEVISVLKDYSDPGCCCCTSGTDSKVFPFRQIATVSADQRGRGCTACDVSMVNIVSTGAAFDKHRRPISGVLNMIVSEPDALVRLINNLRETQPQTVINGNSGVDGGAAVGIPLTALPPVCGSSEGLRCFIALAGNLRDKKIFKVQPQMTTEQLWQEISSRFHLRGTRKFRLELLVSERERVPVEGPGDISANDTLIATPY